MHYTRDTEFCSRVQVAETTKMVSLTTRVRSLSIDTAIRVKCDMVQTAELKRWLDGEYSNTHVVDVRKCRDGGFIANSEWIPLQDLDTNLSQLVERIYNQAKPPPATTASHCIMRRAALPLAPCSSLYVRRSAIPRSSSRVASAAI